MIGLEDILNMGGWQDRKELPYEIRQLILESYLVPGNVIKMGQDICMIFKVMPATEEYTKRFLLENLRSNEYLEVPITAEANIRSYSSYRINAVYEPNYDERYCTPPNGSNMKLVVSDIKSKYIDPVWRRAK